LKAALIALPLLFCIPAARPQVTQQEFTDPVALLQAVAKTYATGVDTFHFESIQETVRNGEFERDWQKEVSKALKGPGALYRIEHQSSQGTYIQASDGVNEWVYVVEAKAYVKRPLPQDWPQFPKGVMDWKSAEIKNAWDMRLFLEAKAAGYKHAEMLPQETILVEGKSYPCYVVHVTSDDRTNAIKDHRSDTTFWIDKTALVFRKEIEHTDNFIMVNKNVHIPLHSDETTTYPVADFDPQLAPEIFQFTPTADAKEVETLEADFGGPPPSFQPKTQLTGQMAPDVSFTSADGKRIALSSFRGKPVLLDLWATWCGPCLMSMPSLGRIYKDVKDKGIAVVTADQDNHAESANAYLARHGYGWTNYHDEDKSVYKEFHEVGVPLKVLIDAQGKVVYEDFGGDEAAVRKAIAALGPEFASVAASEKSTAAPAVAPAH
jgi:thiol-disulfide isomerase/thioredoxin